MDSNANLHRTTWQAGVDLSELSDASVQLPYWNECAAKQPASVVRGPFRAGLSTKLASGSTAYTKRRDAFPVWLCFLLLYSDVPSIYSELITGT